MFITTNFRNKIYHRLQAVYINLRNVQGTGVNNLKTKTKYLTNIQKHFIFSDSV